MGDHLAIVNALSNADRRGKIASSPSKSGGGGGGAASFGKKVPRIDGSMGAASISTWHNKLPKIHQMRQLNVRLSEQKEGATVPKAHPRNALRVRKIFKFLQNWGRRSKGLFLLEEEDEEEEGHTYVPLEEDDLAEVLLYVILHHFLEEKHTKQVARARWRGAIRLTPSRKWLQ